MHVYWKDLLFLKYNVPHTAVCQIMCFMQGWIYSGGAIGAVPPSRKIPQIFWTLSVNFLWNYATFKSPHWNIVFSSVNKVYFWHTQSFNLFLAMYDCRQLLIYSPYRQYQHNINKMLAFRLSNSCLQYSLVGASIGKKLNLPFPLDVQKLKDFQLQGGFAPLIRILTQIKYCLIQFAHCTSPLPIN